MNNQIKRTIHFHGGFKEKYQSEPLEIYADSMFNLFNILTKSVYPELLTQEAMQIVFEDEKGVMTDLFDPEQQLLNTQTKIHIIPNPDGAWIQVVYAIIAVIVAVGISLMLAPKIENTQETASGANWETPENVVGQGGVMPVVLGERRTGSRVASYGIDSTVFRSKVV